MLFKSKTQLFIFIMTAMLSSYAAAKSSDSRPNILLILADDLGYADVSFNGGTDIQTPSLDALAKNGTVFSSAYVSHPFCGPSRAALMTGRYPHIIGAQFNLPSTLVDLGIPLEETFMSKVLQDAGYFTGIVGKWHLGETEKYHPNKRGYDEFYGFLGGGHEYFPSDYQPRYDALKRDGRPEKFVPEYLRALYHNDKEVRETEYLTDGFSREAVNFINKADEKGKPFFLYLSYNAPHAPLQAKKEDIAKFKHIKDEKRQKYAAMVYAMDQGINRIVDALKVNGQFDNTLVVFFSDNGGKLKDGANNYPLKEGKGSVYEGGYRTPMFFHWPKGVPAGKQFEHPILALDLYPTFAGLAGAKIPKTKKLDGKDIWKDFLSGKNAHKDEMIYVMRHRSSFSDAGARKGQWKIANRGKRWALYDLEKDIGEENNLNKTHPEIMKGMVAEMEVWGQTHAQPLWFHSKASTAAWAENDMPRFEQTFSIRKPKGKKNNNKKTKKIKEENDDD